MNRLDESLKGGHALHSNLLHANLITIVYNGYRDLVILHLFLFTSSSTLEHTNK